ncbi:MAG: SpoIIE family protein phosphatase [Acidobacteriota bacterium]|nr:SpoIIE family protein phosphatase [Acidobacteriota bacterium]
MSPAAVKALEKLSARRDYLASIAVDSQEARLLDLMRRVDQAIGAIEVGDWGLCAVCHDFISPESMDKDPLMSVCIGCMSEGDQRALERDLQSAARVQRTLLPPPRMEREGWEMAYLWEPRGLVSGDHVDLILPEQPGAPLHLILGDVAGKGVAASFLQSHLHALFRALAPGGHTLPDLVARANQLFADATSATSYATLLALRLESCGNLAMVNAGHPRPLLADGRGVRPVEGGGLPLGLFGASTYVERTLTLEPGQTLLFYTDGWTEGAVGDEEFGIGRAAAALRRSAALPLPELLAACRADLKAFLGATAQSDDLTLVALRRSEKTTIQ